MKIIVILLLYIKKCWWIYKVETVKKGYVVYVERIQGKKLINNYDKKKHDKETIRYKEINVMQEKKTI